MSATAQANDSNLNAPDLTKEFPRSPREMLGGYLIAARALDKCRALLAGTVGEYHYDCPLDKMFFDFTGISSAEFKDFVATGADDAAVDQWIREKSRHISEESRAVWNIQLREKKLSDMPLSTQVKLNSVIENDLPKGAAVRVLFDIHDGDEGRLNPCEC